MPSGMDLMLIELAHPREEPEQLRGNALSYLQSIYRDPRQPT